MNHSNATDAQLRAYVLEQAIEPLFPSPLAWTSDNWSDPQRIALLTPPMARTSAIHCVKDYGREFVAKPLVKLLYPLLAP